MSKAITEPKSQSQLVSEEFAEHVKKCDMCELGMRYQIPFAEPRQVRAELLLCSDGYKILAAIFN